ncbi:MAG: sulfurtransferase [Acidimicrobiales bacterium]
MVDTRWYPDGRDARAAYEAGHVPGAVHVDLDRWLAGPLSAGGGRHPLPDPSVFAEGMSAAGVGDGTPVVACDDAGGVIAARLVWMLRALGEDAALLDGWDGPLERGRVEPTPAAFTPRPWPADLLVSADDVAALDEGTVLLDARSPERYAGAPDDLDPRAGHIPGARSLPCRENVDPSGRLLPDDVLRARLAAVGVVAGGPAVVSSCGSGVTACHTLLVLEHLGFAPGRLYPGSWSEWSRSERPAVTGPRPR